MKEYQRVCLKCKKVFTTNSKEKRLLFCTECKPSKQRPYILSTLAYYDPVAVRLIDAIKKESDINNLKKLVAEFHAVCGRFLEIKNHQRYPDAISCEHCINFKVKKHSDNKLVMFCSAGCLRNKKGDITLFKYSSYYYGNISTHQRYYSLWSKKARSCANFKEE